MIKDIAPIITFIISMAVVYLVHPLLVKLALKKDIVDKPNARRLNRIPIPVLGGVGVFLGFMASLPTTAAITGTAIPYICIAAIIAIFCMGLVDDIKDLRPSTKFIIQITAIALLTTLCDLRIDNLHGVLGIYEIADYISIPLTIFACVGLINAINLIDGIDGLSSGYCIASGVIFFVFSAIQGNYTNMLMSSAIVGALVPFFFFNVFGKKNKMFIGDSGSHLLGVIFSILTLRAIHDYNPADANINSGIMAFCLAVMAHPVMDTLRVMSQRISKGTSPFKADKTHLHHAIISLGFSHLQTTLIITGLNLLVIATWHITFVNGLTPTVQFFTTLAAAVFFIVTPYFGIVRYKEKYPESFRKLIEKREKEKEIKKQTA